MGKSIELAQFHLSRMMLEARVKAAAEKSLVVIIDRQHPSNEQECTLHVLEGGGLPQLAWVVGPAREGVTIVTQGGQPVTETYDVIKRIKPAVVSDV